MSACFRDVDEVISILHIPDFVVRTDRDTGTHEEAVSKSRLMGTNPEDHAYTAIQKQKLYSTRRQIKLCETKQMITRLAIELLLKVFEDLDIACKVSLGLTCSGAATSRLKGFLVYSEFTTAIAKKQSDGLVSTTRPLSIRPKARTKWTLAE
ncbi:hypothetical protein HYALB_00009724 [Hymenoscyphus albidus]|uniref:Uncharacterized protein n=1 Tax=Hymenoscyphus albidus TaxID=595503 RepID=A0A9N9Q5C7_9HELO|nr:hypothetical protein HYALB_00009724 [Hymenoscyphus albidus]